MAALDANDLLTQVNSKRLKDVIRLAIAEAQLIVEVESPDVERPLCLVTYC